jgi:hypothetical protein
MAIASKHMVDVIKFKLELKWYWDITDNGPIQWFLGFEIKHNQAVQTISINQQAYISAIVEKFKLTNVKHVTNPMESDAQFSKKVHRL